MKNEIKKLSDFFKFLEKFDNQEDIIFRGQTEDKPLLPKIARPMARLHAPILDTEKKIFGEFKRQALPYLKTKPEGAWDWLALAQHHGLPTRLLDWTSNPLASLWFATKEPAVKNRPGVIWAYKPVESEFITQEEIERNPDPLSIKITKIFKPNHVTQRLVTQNGAFTVHAHYPDHGGFIPFEENQLIVGDLKKLIIPATAFKDIRYELDRCGVNNASLFPDLDGLSSHIEFLNSKLSDE